MQYRSDSEIAKSAQSQQVAERIAELEQEAECVRQAAASEAFDMAQEVASLRSSNADEVKKLSGNLSIAHTAASSAAAESRALQAQLEAERRASEEQAAALHSDVSRLQSQLNELRKSAALDAAAAASKLEAVAAAAVAESTDAAEKLTASNEQVSLLRAAQARLQSQLEAKAVELKNAGEGTQQVTL